MSFSDASPATAARDLCLIHIPKTAGRSVTDALFQAYPQHPRIWARTALKVPIADARARLEAARLFVGHCSLSQFAARSDKPWAVVSVVRDPLRQATVGP